MSYFCWLLTVRLEINRLYSDRSKDDLLLLYFSGHRIKDDYGDLYLAVKDTNRQLAGATAVESVWVRSLLYKGGSRRNVVILDCCHSAAFIPGTKASEVVGSPVGIGEAFEAGYGRIVLTASNSIEYAMEGGKLLGDVKTSLFTHFLVEGIKSGRAARGDNSEITVDDLYSYVYKKVKDTESSKLR